MNYHRCNHPHCTEKQDSKVSYKVKEICISLAIYDLSTMTLTTYLDACITYLCLALIASTTGGLNKISEILLTALTMNLLEPS